MTVLLLGCGDDGASSPDGGTQIGGAFTSSGLSLAAMGNGNITMPSYGGPLVAVDGDHVVASGLMYATVTPTVLTVAAADEPITVTDPGTITTSPIDNQTCR